MTSVVIKAEASSPQPSPPPGMTGVKIKGEPSSPPPRLPAVLDDIDNGGPCDAVPLSGGSETSRDMMDSSIGKAVVQYQCADPAKKLYTCLVCGRTFPTKSRLTVHQPVHTGDKPYACDVCPSKFASRRSLNKHKEVHASGVDMFRCSECGVNFRRLTVLQNHEKWHRMEKPHPCHLCPARFSTLGALKNHVLRHTCERPHTCCVCERAFSWRRDLNRHIRRMHGGVRPLMANTGCRVNVATPSNLPSTLPPVLDGSNNEDPSDTALGSPDTSKDIVDSSTGGTPTQHQHVHSDKKPHVCPVCRFKFATKSRLIIHKLVHTSEKQFECDVCPSKFATNDALCRHRKLHASGVDMFRCLECGMTFTKKTVLQKHQRWHKMEKPHPCHLCPARFTTLRMLKFHVLRHTCEKPHTCPVCKSRFSWKPALSTHIRQKHGGVKAALANTDSGVEITMPSNPQTTVPPVLDDTNNEGPADTVLSSNSSESSRDIVDGSTGTLVLHQPVRKIKGPHACLVCGRKFSTRSRLIEHHRNHTGEKPYACEMCPAKFTAKQGLDRHNKLHASGVDVFDCPECAKVFTKMTALQKHLKWHKTEKPHACHLCPARFTARETLKNHVLRHTREKSYVCPMCKSRFSWPASLATHIRRKHPGVQATVANTENKVEITTPRDPLATVPLVLDGTHNEGPADAALRSTGSESSRDIMDSSIG